MPNIIFTVYGWGGSEWNDFYPEDLPQEWRLDYFSHYFSSVVIPADSIRKVAPEQVDEWLESTASDFRFYLEFGTTPQHHIDLIQKRLGDRLSHLVDLNSLTATPMENRTPMQLYIYDGDSDPKAIRLYLEQIQIQDNSRALVMIRSGKEPWKVLQNFELLGQMMGIN